MRWIVPILLAAAPVQALHAADFSYMLVSGNGSVSSMSGSDGDWRRAEAYRSGNAPMLYVRDHGSAYVIRDAAILRQAEAIMKPQKDLGERQGALGEQQGELGRQQGALGAQQGALGAQMADATPSRMRQFGEQQAALGRQQAALGEKQAALGARQAELGRQQAALAKRAEPQFRALVKEAIRRGVAQRVD